MQPTYLLPLGFNLLPLTLFAFSAVIIFCIAGLFYTHFKDNWPQTLGMVSVAVASALKIEQTRVRGFVSGETALLAIGMALFAAGVAWKVWQHQKDEAIKRKFEKPPHKARAHK